MSKKKKAAFTFIDLFAGIGGFHIAMNELGGKCVFASEINEFARKTYEANFKEKEPELFISEKTFNKDIQKQDENAIPDFDILCGGFPCQPFSHAGHRKGFEDTRGTLFFDIARIIKAKRPRAVILENVRGLANHDGGNTMKVIRETMRDLGYSFHWKVLKASDYGVPQHRPRVFIVGFREEDTVFAWPEPKELEYTMSDVLGGRANKTIGFTLRVGGRGSGLHDRRNWDTYLVEGKTVRIGPKEGLMLQGFPNDYVFPVSEVQAMKQLGNSVAVPVVKAVGEAVLRALDGVKIYDERKQQVLV